MRKDSSLNKCLAFVALAFVLALGAVHVAGAQDLQVVIPEDPAQGLGVWFAQVKEVFERENPGVTIEYISSVSGDRLAYPERVNVLIAAGVPPDVVFMHERDAILGGWLTHETLVDLSPHVAQDAELRADSLFRNVAAGWTYQGRLLGLPIGLGLQPFFYDVDAFDAAGLVSPAAHADQDTWTFGNFLGAARRLSRDENGDGQNEQWGYAANWNLDKIWGGYIYSNGGRILDDALTRSRIHEPAAYEAVDFLLSLYQTEGVARTGNIATVRADMSTAGINVGPRALDLGKNVDIGMAPRGASGASVAINLTHVFGIFGSSSKQELAWKFARRSIREDLLADWMRLSLQLPPISTQLETWQSQASELFNRPDLLVRAAGASQGMPFFPQWWTIQDEIVASLTQAMSGGIAARVAMEELSGRINSMLAR